MCSTGITAETSSVHYWKETTKLKDVISSVDLHHTAVISETFATRWIGTCTCCLDQENTWQKAQQILEAAMQGPDESWPILYTFYTSMWQQCFHRWYTSRRTCTLPPFREQSLEAKKMWDKHLTGPEESGGEVAEHEATFPDALEECRQPEQHMCQT
jgi:hypothetical protein